MRRRSSSSRSRGRRASRSGTLSGLAPSPAYASSAKDPGVRGVDCVVSQDPLEKQGVCRIIAKVNGSGAARLHRQPIDIVLTIDASASMGMAQAGQPTAMEKLKDALTAEQNGLVSYLAPQDRVGLVVFNHSASLVHPLAYATGEHKQALLSAIRGIHEAGATNVYAGIKHSFSAIDDSPVDKDTDRQKVVFLLTDGKPNQPQLFGALDNPYLDERMVNLILEERQKSGKPSAPRVFTFGMETADGGDPVNVKILAGIAVDFGGDYRRVQDVDAVSRVVRGEFMHCSSTLATGVTIVFDVAVEARPHVTLEPARLEQPAGANANAASTAFSIKSISHGQSVSRAVIAINASNEPQTVGIQVRYWDMTFVPPKDRVIQQSVIVPPRSRPATGNVDVDTDAVRLVTADAVHRSWEHMLSSQKGLAKQTIQSALQTVRQIHRPHVDSECCCDDYISDLESCDGEHLEKQPFDPEGYGAMRDMWTAHTEQRATDRGRSEAAKGGSDSATKKSPLYATELHKRVLGLQETNKKMSGMTSAQQYAAYQDPNSGFYQRDVQADIRASTTGRRQTIESDSEYPYYVNNMADISTLRAVDVQLLRKARRCIENGEPVFVKQVADLLKKHGKQETMKMIDVALWAMKKGVAGKK